MLGLRRHVAVGSVGVLIAAGLVASLGHGAPPQEAPPALGRASAVAAIGLQEQNEARRTTGSSTPSPVPSPGATRTSKADTVTNGAGDASVPGPASATGTGRVQAQAVKGPSAQADDPPGTLAPIARSYGSHVRQQYLTYLPVQRSSSVAVAVVHGGSWISGKPADVAAYNQFFAAQGIVSFAVGYRLATDAVWPAQRTDLSAAIRAIRAQASALGFRSDRIAVVGVSAGGQLALDFADRVGARGACSVVTYSAPTSMKLVLKDGPKGTQQTRLASAVRTLAPTAELRTSATVPGAPDAADAPALLFSSELDWVNRIHALRYAAAYDGVGPDVQTDVLPGDSRHASGYAFGDPAVLPTSLDFINRHCG